MLQERNTTGKVLRLEKGKMKTELEKKLDRQLRSLQDTIVKIEDIQMQRLVNGLVASILTYPQSELPGIAKDIKPEDVKLLESDSDLTSNQKQMIYEVAEKLSYLKDIIGDAE